MNKKLLKQIATMVVAGVIVKVIIQKIDEAKSKAKGIEQ